MLKSKSKANLTSKNENTKKNKSRETKAVTNSSSNVKHDDIIGKCELDHNSSDESNDFLLNSAFAQSLKGKVKSKINNTKSLKNNSKKLNHIDQIKTKRSSDPLINSDKNPRCFTNIKGSSIFERQYIKKISDLCKFINRQPLDICNYINRSYYYLCIGNYVETLNDTNFVLSHSNDKMLLSKMKCRQGQALWRLKKHNAADECFKESLNLYSNSLSVQCEALRMKIDRLKEMGFSEKNILTVVTEISTVDINDAVAILTASDYIGDDDDDDDNIDDEIDDGIFQSDDEDNISNTTIFIKKLQLDINPEDTTWLDTMNAVNSQKTCTQEINRDSTPVVLKVLNTCSTPKSLEKKNVNLRGIWVGHLTPDITENTLTKIFTKFGKVSFAKIPRGQRYGFVNFMQVGPADKAVALGSIEINGSPRPIKVNITNY